MRARFMFNLGSETTYDSFTRIRLRPDGFLLPPTYATKKLRTYAKEIRKTKRWLVIDNGNFELIGDVRKEFYNESRKLWLRVQQIELSKGRSIRRGELPKSLKKSYQMLANQVVNRIEKITRAGGVAQEDLLAFNPTHLIGVEDIRMAAWLSLNIEPEYLGFRRRKFQGINTQVAKRAKDVLVSLSQSGSFPKYYPVASAMSYNMAYDAGREFARQEITRVSMGFGAFMKDNNYTNHFYHGRRRVDLPMKVPNRYIRTIVVAKGFWKGYSEISGKPPEAFHFLGLGSPIMIALVSLCAGETPELSFDATSPTKDAVSGTMYVSKPAYLKVRLRKVAYRFASNKNLVWDCPCAFCKAFVEKYPFDYSAGHSWYLAQQPKKVKKVDLNPGGALFHAYPLFSEPKSGDLRKAINFAREGHNHWVLETITSIVSKQGNDPKNLAALVSSIVDDYVQHTNSRYYAQVVRTSYAIASGEQAGTWSRATVR